MKLSVFVALTGLVAVAAMGGGSGSILPGQILDLFEQRGIVYESDVVLEAATRAILRAVDNRAKLVDVANQPGMATAPDPAVYSAVWTNKVGYIRLGGVSSNAARQVVSMIGDWAENSLLGCVIDIREAEGGALPGVALLSALCASSGVHVLTLRTVEGENIDLCAATSGLDCALPPLMLLVDSGTAGAVEALAAALKGRPGVLLIGETTSAEGRIREWLDIDDRHRVYLATSTAYLPSGAALTDVGVAPDVVVLPDVGVPPESRVAPLDAIRETCLTATNNSTFLQGLAGDPVLLRAADIIIGLHASTGPGALPETGMDPPEPSVAEPEKGLPAP